MIGFTKGYAFGSGVVCVKSDNPAVHRRKKKFEVLALLLILAPDDTPLAALQRPLQVLIHRKRHRLPRRHPHDPWRDALVKRMETFLLEHVPRNRRDSTHCCLPRLPRRLLQSRLDRVDRCIAQRTHGARDEADEHGLVRREFGVVIGGLVLLQEGFELRVGGEVDGLIRTLAQGCEGDAAVEGAEAFFFDDGVGGMRGVAVFGDVEGVSHGVVLGLEADFDDFHRGDHRDGFGHTGGETGWQGNFSDAQDI